MQHGCMEMTGYISAMTDPDSSIHILLVDDSPKAAERAEEALGEDLPKVKFQVVFFEHELSKALDEGGFQLVVTEQNLRWADGVDVIRHVREAKPDCPIIMFARRYDQAKAVEALKVGVEDYVLKTEIHKSRLGGAVSKALGAVAKGGSRQVSTAPSADATRPDQPAARPSPAPPPKEATGPQLRRPASLQASFTLDAHGQILEVNEGFLQLVGFTDSRMAMNMRLRDLFCDPTAGQRATQLPAPGETLTTEADLYRFTGDKLRVTMETRRRTLSSGQQVLEGSLSKAS